MTEVQFAKQFLTTLDSKNTKYYADHVFNPETFQIRTPYTLPKLAHPPHPLPPRSQSPLTDTPNAGAGTTATTTTITTESSISVDLTLKSTRNPSFTLHLPSIPITTPVQTLKTHIQNVLSSSSTQTRSTPASTTVNIEKIKILYNKKPIPATKPTILHVTDSSNESSQNERTPIEFGVMIMGGCPDPSPSVQTLVLTNSVEPDSTSADVGPESEKAAAEAAGAIASTSSPPAVLAAAAGPELINANTNTNTNTNTDKNSKDPVQPGEPSGLAILQTSEFWDDLQGYLEQRLRNSEVAAQLRRKFQHVAL